MNKCNKDFLDSINMDYTKIDRKLYKRIDLNEIVSKYEIQGDTIHDIVSLENIYGIYSDDFLAKDLLDALDDCFDYVGDPYHTRAVDMLRYDETNVIDKLSLSFIREPISLIEVDVNKHLILTNGIHRFLVLRLIYLNEKSKCKTSDDLEKLKKKFSIPVKKTKVDLLKTYCKFLIDIFQPVNCMNKYYDNIEEKKDGNNETYYVLTELVRWNSTKEINLTSEEMNDYLNSDVNISNDYDENNKKNGKCIIRKFNGEKLVLNDNELINYTKGIILNSKKNIQNILSILNELSDKYESFKKFIQIYFNDVITLKQEEILESGNKLK